MWYNLCDLSWSKGSHFLYIWFCFPGYFCSLYIITGKTCHAKLELKVGALALFQAFKMKNCLQVNVNKYTFVDITLGMNSMTSSALKEILIMHMVHCNFNLFHRMSQFLYQNPTCIHYPVFLWPATLLFPLPAIFYIIYYHYCHYSTLCNLSIVIM